MYQILPIGFTMNYNVYDDYGDSEIYLIKFRLRKEKEFGAYAESRVGKIFAFRCARVAKAVAFKIASHDYSIADCRIDIMVNGNYTEPVATRSIRLENGDWNADLAWTKIESIHHHNHRFA